MAQGKGAVASVSREATEMAIAVLKDGGNAFDAAFSLAFSLCVFHPQAGNIGGGGYMLYQLAEATEPIAINYREQAPWKARQEAFLLENGSPNPDHTALGPRSVCVPGTVKAFFSLHQRFGKLKARDLLLAVAKAARKGALVTRYEAECLNRLSPKLAESPESKRIYVRDTPFQRGDVLTNPHLARTLEILAAEGEAAFYRGAIAEQIVNDLQTNGGFLCAEDLANYAIRESPAIGIDFYGEKIWSIPPESGGAILLQLLAILRSNEFATIPWGSPDYYHYLAQAAKIAFIDRLEYLGDVPLQNHATYKNLFSPAHAQNLFNLINPLSDTATNKLSESMRQMQLGGEKGNYAIISGNDTTHFSVIDAEGNAVSNSYTMNLRYGSKWSVEDAGFLLNGSMDSFSFQEGTENYFGVVGSKPNLFAPGKRPASNMAPVLVTSQGRINMALGTPGGPTIPTTLALVLTSLLVHKKTPLEAVQTHRLHHQAWPDVLYKEATIFAESLLQELQKKNYSLKEKNELIGDVHGVFRSPEGFTGISDYRREGFALGY